MLTLPLRIVKTKIKYLDNYKNNNSMEKGNCIKKI